MPAGAPPPLGRMVQAGRPAGAHILRPGRGARGPLRGRPGEGGCEAGAPAAGPEGARSSAAAARRGSGERRLRPPGRRRGRRVAPPRTVRVSRRGSRTGPSPAPRERKGPGVRAEATLEAAGPLRAPLGRGVLPGTLLPLGAAQVGRGLRLSARSADGRGAGGQQEAGAGGARGEGAVERGAWGRAAAAPRRGGGRGSRGPAARAHRARRRAARAVWPPPSARLPPRALAPASPSGSQLRPPGPAHVTLFPAPQTGARAPCPAPAAVRRPALRWPTSPHGAVPGPGDAAGGASAASSPALASSRSPPWERLERGRWLGLDRRAPPGGVATVTGGLAKRFEVLTRLPVRPVHRESWFWAGGVPEEALGGRLGRGLGEKFPTGEAARKRPRESEGGGEGPLLGIPLSQRPGRVPRDLA